MSGATAARESDGPRREHVFDERLAARMDVMYAAADVVKRRSLIRSALAPAPGQHVLDVGCGPGFAVAELARAVGPGGTVTGVDASEQMLAAARRRCAEHPNVRFAPGDAAAIPLPAAAVDGAICVLVLEYVPAPTRCCATSRGCCAPAVGW